MFFIELWWLYILVKCQDSWGLFDSFTISVETKTYLNKMGSQMLGKIFEKFLSLKVHIFKNQFLKKILIYDQRMTINYKIISWSKRWQTIFPYKQGHVLIYRIESIDAFDLSIDFKEKDGLVLSY